MAHLHCREAAHILDVGIGAISLFGVKWMLHLVFGVRSHRRHVTVTVDKKVSFTSACDAQISAVRRCQGP